MKLADLLPPGIPSGTNPDITGLCTDSRHVKPGDLFVGLPGARVDGTQFGIPALRGGAAAALVAAERVTGEDWDPYVVIRVPEAQLLRITAQVAARFWGDPAQALTLVGVTGTNGKTTTTHLIEHLLRTGGGCVGLVGTLYSRWGREGGSLHQETAAHTTPFAVELQQTLAQMRQGGCEQVVMEVSSHALAQERVWGCSFAAAVWTNLTQDHLDFHGTLDAYWQAKARLFSADYLSQGRAILNGEDPGCQRLLAQGELRDPWVFALDPQASSAQIYPRQVTWGSDHTLVELQTPRGILSLRSPLVGSFNLANLMGAVGAVLQVGLDPAGIPEALGQFTGVPGRMEVIQGDPDIGVVVDYAHTPDGLASVLAAVRPFARGRVLCVFGCGGDRDRGKRPLMGRMAADLADLVIVTSDNPRTEDPQQILQDIVAGMKESNTPYTVQADRQQAIQAGILMAQPGDTVVIAGKGHEDYQILGTLKVHFDDREQARAALQMRGGSLSSVDI